MYIHMCMCIHICMYMCVCRHQITKQGAWCGNAGGPKCDLIEDSCMVNSQWKVGVCISTSNCYITLYYPPVCLGHMLSRFDKMTSPGVAVRVRALVVGDSFVCRFASHVTTTGRSQNLGLEESISGGMVTSIEQAIPVWLDEYQPHIVIFLVAGNDLTHQAKQSWSVGDQLLQLTKWARDNKGVLQLAICSVLDRETYPSTTPAYPNKVVQFNRYIKEVTGTEQGIRYWRHARLVKIMGMLLADGVHLNKWGNGKLHKSLHSLMMSLLHDLDKQNWYRYTCHCCVGVSEGHLVGNVDLAPETCCVSLYSRWVTRHPGKVGVFRPGVGVGHIVMSRLSRRVGWLRVWLVSDLIRCRHSPWFWGQWSHRLLGPCPDKVLWRTSCEVCQRQLKLGSRQPFLHSCNWRANRGQESLVPVHLQEGRMQKTCHHLRQQVGGPNLVLWVAQPQRAFRQLAGRCFPRRH